MIKNTETVLEKKAQNHFGSFVATIFFLKILKILKSYKSYKSVFLGKRCEMAFVNFLEKVQVLSAIDLTIKETILEILTIVSSDKLTVVANSASVIFRFVTNIQ